MSMKIFDMKSTSPSFTYLDKTCDNHTMLHSTEYQDNMFRVKGGQASFKAKFKLLVGRKRKAKTEIQTNQETSLQGECIHVYNQKR